MLEPAHGMLIKRLVVLLQMLDVRIALLINYGMFKRKFAAVLETTLADANQQKFGTQLKSSAVLPQIMPV